MKKYIILYIDDESYALPQLIWAFPLNFDYELVYIQRICDIPENWDFDLVILDFYLDKDGKTALDIIELFAGNLILSFSSSKSKNALMLENGAHYACEKLKGTNENQELNRKLGDIFWEN
jgi:hypothetical protein